MLVFLSLLATSNFASQAFTAHLSPKRHASSKGLKLNNGVVSCISRASSTSTSLLSTKNRHPMPDLNVGLTDDEFQSLLRSELKSAPGRETYSDVYDGAIDAIIKWRQRYRGNPAVWKRIFKKDRVLKELIENAPIIDSVRTTVDANEEPVVIMDLCSGKGYMSMFLSEMLPQDKVDKFILVDKAWAMCNAEVKPHHMNWDHIYGTLPDKNIENESNEKQTYFSTWPIPLHTSKQDLKQSCNQRQIKKYIFDRIDGPIIILAVHLCGTLSLKAIDMFNNHDHVQFFALKPCCLPQMVYAQRNDIFKIGRHEFDAKEVCSNGSFNKKNWTGPPRWHLESKFHVWSDHLYKGIDLASTSSSEGLSSTSPDDIQNLGRKEKKQIEVQVDGGFQNTYIFAERYPSSPEISSE